MRNRSNGAMSSPPRPNIDAADDVGAGNNDAAAAPVDAVVQAAAAADPAGDDAPAAAIGGEIIDIDDQLEVMDAEFLADVTEDEDEPEQAGDGEEDQEAEEEAEAEDPQAALKTRDLVAIFRLWESTHAQSGFDPVPILSR